MRRVIRRRRVAPRRRRFFRRSFRRRGSRRASSSIPKVSRREYSYVTTLNTATTAVGTSTTFQENGWMRLTPPVNVVPYSAFDSLFREYRLVKLLVAIRRRFPEPVVYQPTVAGGTVAASRLASNNIWWAPWSTYDQPAMPPRQTRSAILLSSQWAVKNIRQKVQKFQIVALMGGNGRFVRANASVIADGFDAPSTFPGTEFVRSDINENWQAVPYWGKTPWMSHNLSGTTNSIFSLSSQENRVNLGFIAVENLSPVLSDMIEIRIQATFAHRGRKNLGATTDTTGAFTWCNQVSDNGWALDAAKVTPPTSAIQQDLLEQEETGTPVLPAIVPM